MEKYGFEIQCSGANQFVISHGACAVNADKKLIRGPIDFELELGLERRMSTSPFSNMGTQNLITTLKSTVRVPPSVLRWVFDATSTIHNHCQLAVWHCDQIVCALKLTITTTVNGMIGLISHYLVLSLTSTVGTLLRIPRSRRAYPSLASHGHLPNPIV